MRHGEPPTSKAVIDKSIEKFERLSVVDPSCALAPATVKIRDALQYIDAVKARFVEEEPKVYDEFLALMKDFKNQRSVILVASFLTIS